MFTAINVIILLIPLSASLDFKFNSQQEIQMNESFKLSINADTSEIYDVKIFIQNENKEIISQIYNKGWKNPRLYLKSVFPEQSEFEVKAISFSEKTEICIRLRKTGKTSFEEKCNPISIVSQSIEKEMKTGNNNSKQGRQPDSNKTDKNINRSKLEYNTLSTITPNPPLIKETKEKIILNNNLELTNPILFTTKYQKQQLFIIYIFAAFCVIIIILLALKKL